MGVSSQGLPPEGNWRGQRLSEVAAQYKAGAPVSGSTLAVDQPPINRPPPNGRSGHPQPPAAKGNGQAERAVPATHALGAASWDGSAITRPGGIHHPPGEFAMRLKKTWGAGRPGPGRHLKLKRRLSRREADRPVLFAPIGLRCDVTIP